MGRNEQNDDFLSSWKEIAAYLKCGVRSCIRWEEERGLPVHRTPGLRGSRVFAYKHELDEWLKSAPKFQEGRPGKRAVSRSKPGAALKYSLALFLMLIIVAVFFFFRTKTAGSFRLAKVNIVTAEPDGPGRLRVWGNVSPREYRNIWEVTSSKFNTVRHSSVVLGDIDADGRSEVVVPTFAKATFTRGEKQSVYFKVFLNAYKQGKKGIWKTTFYSDEDCCWEERDFWKNQIILSNLDQDPAAEIVLKTATWVAVFKFMPDKEEIRMRSFLTPVSDSPGLLLESVAAANTDSAGRRIFVTGNELDMNAEHRAVKRGWLFILRPQADSLSLIKSVPLDADLTHEALSIGDIVPSGEVEVYAAGSRGRDDQFKSFLFGWDIEGNKLLDVPIPEGEWDSLPMPRIWISDLTFEKGDDILVGLPWQRRMFLYSWTDGGLSLKRGYALETGKAIFNNINAGDSDGDGKDEIILSGFVQVESEEEGRFYLEVFGFNSLNGEISSRWSRVGTAKGETEVWSIAVGRR